MDKKSLKKIIATLKQRFHAGAHFLKDKSITKGDLHVPLNQANWFLVIGSRASGKTTLLEKSELPFVLSKKNADKTTRFETNWWITRDAVMLDIPATYVSSQHLSLWTCLIRLLKRHAFQKHLDGVIVVLDIETLKKTKHHAVLIKTLSKRLALLRKKFKRDFPLYFIFNKIDTLPCFDAFFGDINKAERQQMWGMHLHPKKSLAKQTKILFADTVRRLRKQLVWKMQREPSKERREQLHQFPHQVEQLEECLVHFSKQLQTFAQQLNVRGLFFTSAFHQSQQTALSLIDLPASPHTQSGYFIHDLLTHITEQQAPARTQRKNNRIATVMVIAATIIIATALTLALTVGRRERALQVAATTLAQFQTPAQNGEPVKNQQDRRLALKQASQALHASLLGKSSGLQQRLVQNYQHMTHATVLPQISQQLARALKQATLSDALRYQVLTAYLMLQAPQDLKPSYLSQVLDQLNPTGLPTKSALVAILNTYKKQNQPLRLDMHAIQIARGHLASLPPSTLAYILLENQQSAQRLTIDFSHNPITNTVFAYQKPVAGIPLFYTGKVASTLTPAYLANIAQQALNGNTILGPLNHTGAPSAIMARVWATYSAHYDRYWQALINNIILVQKTTVSGLHQQLTALTQKKSPAFLLLSQLLQQNLPDNVQLTTSLMQLKQFLSLKKQAAHINQTLQQLQRLINQVNAEKGHSQTAFSETKQRFYGTLNHDALKQLMNIAQQAPPPLRNWFNHLAQNTWVVLLRQTKQYLNTTWQENILPAYQKTIQARYPFNQNADKQVSLNDFIQFFNPQGTLNHFIENDLMPFINTDTPAWQLKNKDGQSINISSQTLKTLMQAKKIQRIFFPNNRPNPFVRFRIQPSAHDENIAQINITLGNQHIQFSGGRSLSPQTLTWPDNANKTNMAVSFIGAKKIPTTYAAKGPWAIMTVLKQATLQPTTINHQPLWVATFTPKKPDGHLEQKQLRFYFASTENPFSPQLFADFVLRENIVS
jgi:type VI secretion system protein ImpL